MLIALARDEGQDHHYELDDGRYPAPPRCAQVLGATVTSVNPDGAVDRLAQIQHGLALKVQGAQ